MRSCGRIVAVAVGAVLSLALGAAWGQEGVQPIGPQKEHEWLKQFVGEWTCESKFAPAPGAPEITCKGHAKARSLGGLWIICEHENSFGDQKISAVLTVGVDPNSKKYIGSWVDSMHNHFWKYQGEVDSTGKVLSLIAEGPDMTAPGKTANFKDAWEFKSQDEMVLTSSMQGPDGKWIDFMTMRYQRVK